MSLKYYEEILQLEKSVPSSVFMPTEENAAYNRVATVFEKQVFWSGSLTDFVFAMDALILNGFIKANEVEESLAHTFSHKAKGKKVIQKLTAAKIKNRRRNMKGGRYTESEQVRATVGSIRNKLTK